MSPLGALRLMLRSGRDRVIPCMPAGLEYNAGAATMLPRVPVH
jgi:hypothetical protein